MTQLLTDVGQMAFLSIGFHTNLILNKLRNQQRVEDDRRADEEARQKRDSDEQEVRAKLEVTKKRLALLKARVGENTN